MTKTTNNEIGLLHNGECPSLLFLGIELFSHTSMHDKVILFTVKCKWKKLFLVIRDPRVLCGPWKNLSELLTNICDLTNVFFVILRSSPPNRPGTL